MNRLLCRFTKEGERGVKIWRETYDVIYGWPLVLEWLADEAGGVVVGYELKDQPSCKKNPWAWTPNGLAFLPANHKMVAAISGKDFAQPYTTWTAINVL